MIKHGPCRLQSGHKRFNSSLIDNSSFRQLEFSHQQWIPMVTHFYSWKKKSQCPQELRKLFQKHNPPLSITMDTLNTILTICNISSKWVDSRDVDYAAADFEFEVLDISKGIWFFFPHSKTASPLETNILCG